jgi:hypothetical protein
MVVRLDAQSVFFYQIKCVFRPKRDAGTSSDGPVIQSESKIRRQEKIPGGTGCRYT